VISIEYTLAALLKALQGRIDRLNELNYPNKPVNYMSPRISNPFSVFIPVYNEEGILVSNTERLIFHLDRYGVDYEIIIGSNGSSGSHAIGYISPGDILSYGRERRGRCL